MRVPRNQLPSPHIIQVAEGCLQIRELMVQSYALLEEDRIILIDGGFIQTRPREILSEFALLGYSPEQVTHILLTHGHIDHTLNLRRWMELTGAILLAPRRDHLHIEGRYPYRGLNRVCGRLEALTRRLFDYAPPRIDESLEPEAELPLWGGLRVVPLPGHTFGHCGFYSPRRQLLFSGDLFADFLPTPAAPPRVLTVDPELARESIRRAASLPLAGGVLPNHGHSGSPIEHARDLRRLARRLSS